LVPAAAQRDGDGASRYSAVEAGSACGRRLAATDHAEISPVAAYRKPLPCAVQGMTDAATPKHPCENARCAEVDDLNAYIPPRLAVVFRAESATGGPAGSARGSLVMCVVLGHGLPRVPWRL